MYETRITIFIDILGFRNIIKQTESNQTLQQKIFEVLNSMTTENLQNEMFAELNLKGDGDEERKKLKESQASFSKTLLSKSSIITTHFSDSIVLSINLEIDMYAMSLFEYIGRLIYRLWKDFHILIRGGVAVEGLIHENNGVLFGPAMVKAYDIETNLANFPRIIFDDLSHNIVKNSPFYPAMKHLFKDFSGSNKIEIKKGLEINLATVFSHLLNSHFSFHPLKKQEILETIENSKIQLAKLIEENTANERVRSKYQYLKDELENVKYPTY
ncbi:hypothetical protein [Paenimyroides baculatum]|uniref:Guanylate cyclase domain-containing protein n=1 Tax=Paenimyroides baculatum TaxID=2608000 RepID=A0A5M6CKR0_9FLAO|nr:hypothetical protein [Paenimyroides baculatum]KAA5535607.1 hypothetical protein F0460_07445 [Paenimyroides baculatum]